MANDFSREVAQARADLQSIKDEVRSLNDEIIKASQSARKLGSSFKPTSSGDLNTLVTQLNSNIQKLNTNLGNQTKAQRTLESQTKKLTDTTDRAKKSYSELNSQLSKSGGGFKTIITNLKSLGAAFGIVGGVQLFANIAKNVFETTKKLQSLHFALRTVTDGLSEYSRVTAFISDITQRYGANIITTTERYTKFLAAAKQSNVTLDATEKIFGSVTKAAGVLGLKTDELNGIYLALEQMLSKGKVTTEELRRQLGERLPGAFGIMADAIGVNVSELDSLLRSGQILSADVLPKFASQLEKAYGIENITNVQTLVAEQQKLNNAWVEFVGIFSEGGSGSGLVGGVLRNLTNELNESKKQMENYFLFWKDGISFADQYKVAVNSFSRFLGRFVGVQKGFYQESVDALKKDTKERELNEDAIRKQTLALSIAYDMESNKGNKRKYGIDLLEGNDKVRTKEYVEGLLKAQKELLDKSSAANAGPIKEQIRLLEEELKAWDNKTKKQKEAIEAVKGSISFLENHIKTLKQEQNNLAKNSQEFQNYTKRINEAEEALGKLQVMYNSGGKVAIAYHNAISGDKVQSFAGAGAITGDALVKNDGVKGTTLDNVLPNVSDAQDRADRLKRLVGDVSETFADLFDIDMSKFDTLIDGIYTGFDTLEDKVRAWGDVTKEVIGAALDASLQRYDIELQEAQRSRDLILENDLSTQKQKRLAQKKFDEEERRIKTEKAKQERKNNLIKIAVDTAVGVAAALSLGVPGIALGAIILALGIAQAAIVASQPLPQFAEGYLDGKYQGKALVNDGGRDEVLERNGKAERIKGRNKIIDMKKGDKIHKSVDSFLDYHDIDKAVWDMNMESNGNTLNSFVTDAMLFGEISKMRKDFKETADKMEMLAKRPINVKNKVVVEHEYKEFKM